MKLPARPAMPGPDIEAVRNGILEADANGTMPKKLSIGSKELDGPPERTPDNWEDGENAADDSRLQKHLDSKKNKVASPAPKKLAKVEPIKEEQEPDKAPLPEEEEQEIDPVDDPEEVKDPTEEADEDETPEPKPKEDEETDEEKAARKAALAKQKVTLPDGTVVTVEEIARQKKLLADFDAKQKKAAFDKKQAEEFAAREKIRLAREAKRPKHELDPYTDREILSEIGRLRKEALKSGDENQQNQAEALEKYLDNRILVRELREEIKEELSDPYSRQVEVAETTAQLNREFPDLAPDQTHSELNQFMLKEALGWPGVQELIKKHPSAFLQVARASRIALKSRQLEAENATLKKDIAKLRFDNKRLGGKTSVGGSNPNGRAPARNGDLNVNDPKQSKFVGAELHRQLKAEDSGTEY